MRQMFRSPETRQRLVDVLGVVSLFVLLAVALHMPFG